MPSVASFKKAFSSKQAFLDAIAVDQSERASTEGAWVWSNHDMDPTPPEERTWNWWNYASIWWQYGFNVGVWSLGSSLVAYGLLWWQALICLFLGYLIGACFVVMNSRSASRYHFGFPVAQRISFGMFGSTYPVLARATVALLWVGVSYYQAGLFLSIAFRCIFGHKWNNLANTIPANQSITTQKLIATMIIWICGWPIMFMKIHKMRYLWLFNSIVVPPCIIGLFIYCMHASGGHITSHYKGQKVASGANLAWAFMYGIQTVIGKTSPLISGQPDLARYAKHPSATVWSQLLIIPIFNTLVASLGIFATSSLQIAWGTTYWNPWDVCTHILDIHWTPGVRFAILLFASAIVCAQVFGDFVANTIPFGADIASICPKYMDINRGMIFGYILSLVIRPWFILANSSAFLTFLSGYSIFMAGIGAIAITDYFLVRKGNVSVPDLYKRDSVYWYTAGINFRAWVAYLFSVVPVIPGFLASFGYKTSVMSVHLYKVGWLYGVCTACVVYLALNYIFPTAEAKIASAEPFESYELKHREFLDGFVSSETSSPSLSSADDEKDIGSASATPVPEVLK